MDGAASDPPRSDLEAVRAYFRNFAEIQAPRTGSPLYAVLCLGVVEDAEMLELATHCPPTQPAANVLLAAVHALLLRGERHPLREYYPDVVKGEGEPRAPEGAAYPLFRDFVARHREEIVAMLRTRNVQTNVVRRTTVMLPLFATVWSRSGGAPLCLIELGSSAGLNLHWDRYRHVYRFASGEERSWGDPGSPLQLSTQVQSAVLPEIPRELAVAWRIGVDLAPIDVDDAEQWLWLRALVFPEHLERHGELEAAARVARAHRAEIMRGDAIARLPELLSRAPHEATLCLYATAVLVQLAPESRRALLRELTAFSRDRPLWLLTLDGTPDADAHLRIGEFAAGERHVRHVADAHPHGRWIRWLEADAQRT
jgi:hypothetical protein